MGVYIPNMEKPKKCVGCPIDERWCKLWKDFDSWDVETHPDCPLIEIDDELFKKAESAYVLQQIRSR